MSLQQHPNSTTRTVNGTPVYSMTDECAGHCDQIEADFDRIAELEAEVERLQSASARGWIALVIFGPTSAFVSVAMAPEGPAREWAILNGLSVIFGVGVTLAIAAIWARLRRASR